jgi:hypothetical protein
MPDTHNIEMSTGAPEQDHPGDVRLPSPSRRAAAVEAAAVVEAAYILEAVRK